MGNNTSTSVTDVINITSNSITNTMKSATTSSDIRQTLSVDCDGFNTAVLDFKSKCITDILTQQAGTDDNVKLALLAQEMKDVCNSGLQCGANNITMGSSLVFNASTFQKAGFAQTTQNNISDALKAAAQNAGGIIGGDTSTNISTYTKLITNNTIDDIITSITNANVAQTVSVKDGTVQFISMNSTSDFIAKELQKDKTIQKAASDVAKSISASAGGGTSIMKIVIIILICVACAGLAYWLYKKYSSSGTTGTTTTGTTGTSSSSTSNSSTKGSSSS